MKELTNDQRIELLKLKLETIRMLVEGVLIPAEKRPFIELKEEIEGLLKLEVIEPKIKDNTFLYFGKEFDTSDWPDWAKWIAIDSTGNVFLYEKNTSPLDDVWRYYDNIYEHIGIFTAEEMESIDWKETLVEL